MALPLHPAALKRWYIHLQGLITTWHVPHLQQTLSWQQSTKRSMGCGLINKYHSTSKKKIWVKTHTSDYINFHIVGNMKWDQRWHLAAEWGNMDLRPDLNKRWSHRWFQNVIPIIFIFCQHLKTKIYMTWWEHYLSEHLNRKKSA